MSSAIEKAMARLRRGAGAAAAAEAVPWRDGTVETLPGPETVLTLPPGVLDPDAPDPLVLEAFRRIKRPLLDAVAADPDAPLRRAVVVCSARPGEGKTHCAASLAMALAMEQDVDVVLVDADVHKKGLSRRFGAADAAGLFDVLDDGAPPWTALALPVAATRLRLLPAGAWRRDAAERLAGPGLRSWLDAALIDPATLLVFDTPPLSACNDAAVLAARLGQAVLVVAAGETPRTAVQEALAALPRDLPVGLVFNKATERDPAVYDGERYLSDVS
ncbi:MAG: hypothetical protein KatS3mg121_0318 [Gammaproteobacteria bacterium]|nr:MAG: hypothetical protein KatS3mg121_0318 [Gammaproteobacteria bacterium]